VMHLPDHGVLYPFDEPGFAVVDAFEAMRMQEAVELFFGVGLQRFFLQDHLAQADVQRVQAQRPELCAHHADASVTDHVFNMKFHRRLLGLTGPGPLKFNLINPEAKDRSLPPAYFIQIGEKLT
jgi:hypothetical protein